VFYPVTLVCVIILIICIAVPAAATTGINYAETDLFYGCTGLEVFWSALVALMIWNGDRNYAGNPGIPAQQEH